MARSGMARTDGGGGQGRADRGDGHLHRHLAPALEAQRHGHDLALDRWLRQRLEHQMQPSGLQHHGLARSDRQPVSELAHGHDAVRDTHLMNLQAPGKGHGAADQRIRLRAPIGDPGVAAADLRAGGRLAGPGALDGDVADAGGARRNGGGLLPPRRLRLGERWRRGRGRQQERGEGHVRDTGHGSDSTTVRPHAGAAGSERGRRAPRIGEA